MHIYIIKIVNHSYIRTCAIKKSRTKSYNKHSISFIVLVSHVKSYRRQERQYKGIVMVCQNKPFLHQYHLLLFTFDFRNVQKERIKHKNHDKFRTQKLPVPSYLKTESYFSNIFVQKSVISQGVLILMQKWVESLLGAASFGVCLPLFNGLTEIS